MKFPTQIDLPATSASAFNALCSITVYGTTTTCDTIVSNGNRQVTFQNLFSSSALTPDSSKTIQVVIQQVRNPKSATTSDSFEIYTSDSSEDYIDQVTSGLTVTPNQPASITINAAIATSTLPGVTTQLTIRMTADVDHGSGYIGKNSF